MFNFFRPKPVEDSAQIKAYQLEIEVLKHQLSKMGPLQEQHHTIYDIPVDIKDAAPTDGPKRVAYAAQVAGFHTDIMKPKLIQMISTGHNLLETKAETDDRLRGAIYAFREMIHWGDRMVNEHMANISEGDNKEES